jgi:hypothetical protein
MTDSAPHLLFQCDEAPVATIRPHSLLGWFADRDSARRAGERWALAAQARSEQPAQAVLVRSVRECCFELAGCQDSDATLFASRLSAGWHVEEGLEPLGGDGGAPPAVAAPSTITVAAEVVDGDLMRLIGWEDDETLTGAVFADATEARAAVEADKWLGKRGVVLVRTLRLDAAGATSPGPERRLDTALPGDDVARMCLTWNTASTSD